MLRQVMVLVGRVGNRLFVASLHLGTAETTVIVGASRVLHAHSMGLVHGASFSGRMRKLFLVLLGQSVGLLVVLRSTATALVNVADGRILFEVAPRVGGFGARARIVDVLLLELRGDQALLGTLLLAHHVGLPLLAVV